MLSVTKRVKTRIAAALLLFALLFTSPLARAQRIDGFGVRVNGQVGRLYDVRAFGAIGDGVSDDTAAIRRAFQAVMTAKTGTVWFPCGTYYYTATMALYGASDADADRLNGVTIAGEHCAILKHPDLYFSPWNTNLATPDGAVFLISHADNVLIRGLMFQGFQNNNRGVADSVIHLTGRGRNNTVEDVVVYDHWRGTPIDYSGSERGIVQNNFIFNSSLGIQQSSVAGSAIVSGNVISGQHTFAGNTGAQIYVSGVHSSVIGNYVEVPTSTEYGIQIADAADYVEVTGNVVRGIATCTAGITYFPSGSTYGSMTGNSVRNCTTGLAIAGVGHSIIGNTVYGNGAGTDGIRLYLGTNPATYVSVSGNNLQNVVTGITGGGFAVDHATIADNVFGSGVTTPLSMTGWTSPSITPFLLSTTSVLTISSNTIAPTSVIHHVGAGLIKTITVPVTCTPTCQIQIVPDAAYTYDATGNIVLPAGGGTAVINRLMIFFWDGTKWNPSY